MALTGCGLGGNAGRGHALCRRALDILHRCHWPTLDFVKCRRLTNEVVAKGEVDQHCRMMDANRCREYARRCIEKANDAPDKEQSMLFDLAAAWLRLAADLDHNETPRDDVNELSPIFGDGLIGQAAVAGLQLACL